jgi:hypothetical protein
MSPARDLLREGACVIATDWPGRGRVLHTQLTLAGDVLVAVERGFAGAPDAAAIAAHGAAVRATLEGLRRVHRRIALFAQAAGAAAPIAASGAATWFGSQAAEAVLPWYAWSLIGAVLGAPLIRRARDFGLRLAWRWAQRRVVSAG